MVTHFFPEENIQRLSPMYSVSVGDIIEDESGVKNVVASFGFETLERGESIMTVVAKVDKVLQ